MQEETLGSQVLGELAFLASIWEQGSHTFQDLESHRTVQVDIRQPVLQEQGGFL